MTANAVAGAAGVGVRVRNSRHTAVSGNTVSDAGAEGIQVWNAVTGISVAGNVVDRSGNAGVQILNASDFNVRANVVRSSGRATKVEQDATGIVVYSRDATAARGTVSTNRAFDPTSPATQVHGTGTAGAVTNVVFDANVVDGNASVSHGTMLTNFPGGATLLPTRAIRSVAVGRTQVAVLHGLGPHPRVGGGHGALGRSGLAVGGTQRLLRVPHGRRGRAQLRPARRLTPAGHPLPGR